MIVKYTSKQKMVQNRFSENRKMDGSKTVQEE
jgi:hypothetical protein